MKNSPKLATLIVIILAILVLGGAYLFMRGGLESSNTVSEKPLDRGPLVEVGDAVMPPLPAEEPERLVIPGWNTYTSKKYDFTFQYPPSWTLREQDSQTILLASNKLSPRDRQTVSLSFFVITDPNYYTGGDIHYDIERKGFVDDSSGPSCLKPAYALGTFVPVEVKLPVYQLSRKSIVSASAMSAAILTDRGYYLAIDELSERPMDGNVSKLYQTLSFINGAKARVSDCESYPGKIVPLRRVALDEPIVFTSPVRGETWVLDGTRRITWKAKDGISGNMSIDLVSAVDGWSCILGVAPAKAGSFTVSLTENQTCPSAHKLVIEPGDYYFSALYPYEAQDPFNTEIKGGLYSDNTGTMIPLRLVSPK